MACGDLKAQRPRLTLFFRDLFFSHANPRFDLAFDIPPKAVQKSNYCDSLTVVAAAAATATPALLCTLLPIFPRLHAHVRTLSRTLAHSHASRAPHAPHRIPPHARTHTRAGSGVASERAGAGTRACMHVRACVHACMRACMRACTCVRACVHACMAYGQV